MVTCISFIKKCLRKIIRATPPREISDNDLEYFLWICSLYIRIKNIPGHIAEIGVADGRNTVMFGMLIKQFNDTSIRQYIGFDTFDGFIERDLVKDTHLSKDAWKINTLNGVLERCKVNSVSEVVELFQGDAIEIVPDVLEAHKGKKFQPGMAKFALLYIDCNASIPARLSMENFLPYMVPGGMIVIDEKLQGGESEALIEFAKSKNLNVERLGGNEVPMAIIIPNGYGATTVEAKLN